MLNKKDDLKEVEEDVRSCVGCNLCFERNRVVFGEGDINADIILLGEGPGQSEDECGKPFVGKSGKLLSKWIEGIGFKRGDVYIANIVKCRPPNNRNPKPDEISRCISFLHQQINIINPKVMVLLGAVALKSLFKDQSLGIMKNRGNWKEYNGVLVMPTYHPAFLLRQMSKKNIEAVKNDFEMVKKELKSEYKYI